VLVPQFNPRVHWADEQEFARLRRSYIQARREDLSNLLSWGRKTYDQLWAAKKIVDLLGRLVASDSTALWLRRRLRKLFNDHNSVLKAQQTLLDSIEGGLAAANTAGIDAKYLQPLTSAQYYEEKEYEENVDELVDVYGDYPGSDNPAAELEWMRKHQDFYTSSEMASGFQARLDELQNPKLDIRNAASVANLVAQFTREGKELLAKAVLDAQTNNFAMEAEYDIILMLRTAPQWLIDRVSPAERHQEEARLREKVSKLLGSIRDRDESALQYLQTKTFFTLKREMDVQKVLAERSRATMNFLQGFEASAERNSIQRLLSDLYAKGNWRVAFFLSERLVELIDPAELQNPPPFAPSDSTSRAIWQARFRENDLAKAISWVPVLALMSADAIFRLSLPQNKPRWLEEVSQSVRSLGLEFAAGLAAIEDAVRTGSLASVNQKYTRPPPPDVQREWVRDSIKIRRVFAIAESFPPDARREPLWMREHSDELREILPPDLWQAFSNRLVELQASTSRPQVATRTVASRLYSVEDAFSSTRQYRNARSECSINSPLHCLFTSPYFRTLRDAIMGRGHAPDFGSGCDNERLHRLLQEEITFLEEPLGAQETLPRENKFAPELARCKFPSSDPDKPASCWHDASEMLASIVQPYMPEGFAWYGQYASTRDAVEDNPPNADYAVVTTQGDATFLPLPDFTLVACLIHDMTAAPHYTAWLLSGESSGPIFLAWYHCNDNPQEFRREIFFERPPEVTATENKRSPTVWLYVRTTVVTEIQRAVGTRVSRLIGRANAIANMLPKPTTFGVSDIFGLMPSDAAGAASFLRTNFAGTLGSAGLPNDALYRLFAGMMPFDRFCGSSKTEMIQMIVQIFSKRRVEAYHAPSKGWEPTRIGGDTPDAYLVPFLRYLDTNGYRTVWDPANKTTEIQHGSSMKVFEIVVAGRIHPVRTKVSADGRLLPESQSDRVELYDSGFAAAK
jgi:hypothetical protein